jgi:hypothetical protein
MQAERIASEGQQFIPNVARTKRDFGSAAEGGDIAASNGTDLTVEPPTNATFRL